MGEEGERSRRGKRQHKHTLLMEVWVPNPLRFLMKCISGPSAQGKKGDAPILWLCLPWVKG